jgi:RNA binding exosome subunit
MIEISAIAHATEDLNKVHEALMNVVPKEIQGEIAFTRGFFKGHHGNPIIRLKAKIRGERLAKPLVRSLFSKLGEEDKKALSTEFDRYVDEEGNLYIRLDKQSAYLGKLRLRQDDPVRVRIKFNAAPAAVESVYEASGS